MLTEEERGRLERAERCAAEARWPDTFREFQLLLDSVRTRADREEERLLMRRFANVLERAGEPVRARVTREYLRRGFRDPTGHGRLGAAEPAAKEREPSGQA